MKAKTFFSAALAFAAMAVRLAALADGVTAVNPVTGETETYTYEYVGTGTSWGTAANWSPEGTPFIANAGAYEPAIVKGKTAVCPTMDGWNIKLGAYNGANIQITTLSKMQCDTDQWITVDATSYLSVGTWSGGNIGQNGTTRNMNFYVANENGLAFLSNFSTGNDYGLVINYYLAGNGSVEYQAALGVASHVIKQADVVLTESAKAVRSKTLVSFGSSSKTFTADGEIRILDRYGVVLTKTLVTSVNTTGATTLTTANDVGECEVVQTSTGIVLYYVDGPGIAYQPSISVNFTSGTANLTTEATVGLGGYGVPGAAWNNMPGSAGTLSSVYEIDAAGNAMESGAAVSVSGTRGYWSCSGCPAATDVRNGYIDESDGQPAPTVTVTGIPSLYYRVVVYRATDSANVQFSYLTINGTDYTYVDGAVAEGTTSWGNTGAANSALAMEEGVNVFVSDVLSGDLTVTGHRVSSSERGCIAAIQVIYEEVDDPGTKIIRVDGPTQYEIYGDENYVNVMVVGSGTLTLQGEGSLGAETFSVAPNVTVNMDGINAAAVTGSGTVVYDGELPGDCGWSGDGWTGTVWLRSISAVGGLDFNDYGNAASSVKLTGVVGSLKAGAVVCAPAVVLADAGATVALNVSGGTGGSTYTFSALAGDGTLKGSGSTGATADATHYIRILEWADFAGAIDDETRAIVFTTNTADSGVPWESSSAWTKGEGVVYIDEGASVAIASGATWKARRYVVDGTLTVNGAIDAQMGVSSAVAGSGTAIFTVQPPTTASCDWWNSDAWTGTVTLSGLEIDAWDFNDYGNAASLLRLSNCRGSLKPGVCNPALELVGTFTWTDGTAGLENAFKVATLKGSGNISILAQGEELAVWQITDDWSEFTGAVTGNNTDGRRVIAFGATLPDEVEPGEVYVAPDSLLEIKSSGSWWFLGKGFVVDGTLKAASRSKWGGGTAMLINDTGVLEITASGNVETSSSYNLVTGTGSVKFSGSGYYLISSNYPSNFALIDEKAEALVIPANGATIGSLSGDKGFRSDWGATPAAGRYLTIKQAKNTVWNGLINQTNAHRLTGVVVDAGESTTGTLTMTAEQKESVSATLAVNGSVNLTGTWVGDVTVTGAFGGTGSITGGLAFAANSTFKVFGADEDGLAVSGTITYPDGDGKVAVDVSELEAENGDVVILTAADVDLDKFVLAEGTADGYSLSKSGSGALVLTVAKVKQQVSFAVSLGASGDSSQPADAEAGAFEPATIASIVGGTLVDGQVVLPAPTISVVGSEVTVTVELASDKTSAENYAIVCKLQYATALSSPMAWKDVEGDGASAVMGKATLKDAATGASRFYRVVVASIAAKQ